MKDNRDVLAIRQDIIGLAGFGQIADLAGSGHSRPGFNRFGSAASGTGQHIGAGTKLGALGDGGFVLHQGQVAAAAGGCLLRNNAAACPRPAADTGTCCESRQGHGSKQAKRQDQRKHFVPSHVTTS